MSLSGYFDYAAATPVDKQVAEAMYPYFSEYFYNPSASYAPSRQVKKELESVRADVAAIIGVRSAEVIFTAGGTEANNMAIYGVIEQYTGANIVISAIEHESIRAVAEKYKFKECAVSPDGIVDTSNLAGLIDEKTVLVSVMLANNEVGSIQPIRRISQAIEAIRKQRKKSGNKLPLYLHTDAAQAANYLDLHVSRLGVDLMSLNGGKIYGPKQTGILYVRGGIILKPLVVGGGQERNMRSGTENLAGAVGFAKALEIAAAMRRAESERLQKLQKQFIELVVQNIPGSTFNGSLKSRLPNNLHFTVDGQDNERLLMLLDARGIYAATGSACSASNEQPSHVLEAIGLTENQIRSSLRFTTGRFTDETGVKQAVETLVSVLA